jgi:hypothetical protein
LLSHERIGNIALILIEEKSPYHQKEEEVGILEESWNQ